MNLPDQALTTIEVEKRMLLDNTHNMGESF